MLLSILNLFLVFQLSSPKVVLNAIAGNHINDLYAINPTVATELAKKWVINGIPDENQVKVSYCAYHTIGGLGITPGGSSLSRTYTDLPPHGIFFFVITLTAIDDWEPGQKIYVSVDNQVVLSYEPYLYIATEGKQYCGSDTKETVLYANGAAYHSASSLTFSISSDSNPQAAFSINDLKGIFREKGTYAERGCLVPRYLVTDIPSICPCLTKQYYDPASSSCKSCYPTCSSCFGPSAAECYGCGGSKTFDVTTGECVYCTSNCGTCYGSAANQCALCNTNYLTVAGTCSPTCDSPYVSESIDLYKFCYCPEKSYPDNGQCLPCSSGCLECTSGTACTTCDPSTSLVDGKCQCPTGTFFVEGSGCVGACSLGCNECPSNTVCTACDTGTSLVDGVCQCPSGRYYISGAGCSGVCPLGCTACTSNTVCTECNSGPSLVDGKCQCPSGTFYIEGSGCTGTCSQGCNRCSSGTVCTECYSGPSLVSGQCQCLQGKYYILGSGCTGTCSLGCNVCASDTVCTTCQSSASLVNNLCQCPNGKFFIQGSGCTGTCSQGCNRCTSEAVCTECHSGPSLVSGQCQCPSGTFYVGGSGCTGTCSQGCNRCSSETVCTECYTGPTIVNDQCQCPIETFYILGSGCTGTCSLGCNVCSNETFCTECRSPYSLQVLGSEQICKTPCQDTNQYMKAGAVCVSSCDFPLTATTEGTGETQAKFCTNACDAGPNIALYWDGSCQATCSRYLRIENGEYFCDACAPGLFSYSGRTCLPICPEPYTQRFYGGSQFCDRPCPEGQYFNSDNMECMEGCEYPYQIVADDFCAINLSEDQVATVAALAKGAGVMDFAGTTVGRSVGLVQFTNPIPTFIQLFTDMLSYLRYVNVKYPSNLHYYFSKQASDGMAAIPQMTPEMLSHFPKNMLPKKFEANQELHSSFLVNFWQSFVFLLIIAVSIGALIVLERLKKKPKLIALVHENLDDRLRWNFTLTLFTSYIPNLVLFSSLEFSTFNPSGVPPVLSFLICIGFNVLIIAMFIKLFKVILANWTLQKNKVAQNNSEKKAEEEKVDSSLTRYASIFKQCRTDSFLQQAYMFITIGRVYLYSLIIGYLYNFPQVQPILIIVLSVLTLAYVILIKPVDGKLELALMIGQEILMLGVNICVLILSRYDAVDEETNNTRTSIGTVAIVMSMTLSSLGLVYLGIKTLLQLKENYPMIKEKIQAFQQKMLQNKSNKKVSIETRAPRRSVLLSLSDPCTPRQGGTDESLKMPGESDKHNSLDLTFSPRKTRIQEHPRRDSGQDVMLGELGEMSERHTLTLVEHQPRLSRFEREFNLKKRSSQIHPLGKEKNENLLKLNSLDKDSKLDDEALWTSNHMSPIFKVQSGGGNLDVIHEM